MDPQVDKPLIEWGVASLTLPGQPQTGDRHLVTPFPQGLLCAAMDGLGHGPPAAAAAARAVALLQLHPSAPVAALARLCHDELRQTRGVVLSLASFDLLARTVTWLGVGNVAAVFLPHHPHGRAAPARLIPRPGVVGDQLPNLHPESFPLNSGGTLLFATDGVRPDFADQLSGAEFASPQRIADQVLQRFASRGDDALVLVVRCAGFSPPAGEP